MKAGTRRIYRRTFRRVRLYLPLILLLFSSLLLFLPISADWLRREAEDQARDVLGTEVEIDRLEVTVARARIEAFGLRAGASSGRPFELGRVELDGRLSGLLAGGEKWPDNVTVDGLPSLRLARDEKGVYDLRGAFQTLLGIIESMSGAPAAPGTSGGKEGRGLGRTPEVLLRGLPIEIEAFGPEWPGIKINFDRIQVDERPSRNASVVLRAQGSATANTTESFNFGATYFPGQERIVMSGQLSGVSVPFSIPGISVFSGRADGLELTVDLSRGNDGAIVGLVKAEAARFEVRQNRLGGERWADEPLQIDLQFRFEPEDRLLTVDRLSLYGEQVDIAMGGTATLGGDFPGEARLEIERLPPAAMALGRSELTERIGLRYEAASSSPTLRLEAETKGLFAKPKSLSPQVNLELASWNLISNRLPQPVLLEQLQIRLSDGAVRLGTLNAAMGDLQLAAQGTLPLMTPEAVEYGALDVQLDGDLQAIFDAIMRQRLLPREINSLSAPISLDASLPVAASWSIQKGWEFLWKRDQLTASLTWREGELGLRTFGEPLRFDPGEVRFEGGNLAVDRIRAHLGDLDLRFSGSVVQPLEHLADLENLSGQATIISSGSFPQLAEVVRWFVSLPPLPRDLAGNYRLELDLDGQLAHPEQASYEARLLIEEGAATIDTPFEELPFTGIQTELVMNRERLEIRQGRLLLENEEVGNATVDFTASADANLVRADVNVRGPLGLATRLAPRALKDLYMEGMASVTGWATLEPRRPLPEAPDAARRWLALIEENPSLGTGEDADLRLNFEAVNRQEESLAVFPRDFPVPIRNIRGNARVSPEGLRVVDARADVGSSKDVEVQEFTLEAGRPSSIAFTAHVERLDINEWMTGWKEQEWASKPASFTPRWRRFPEPYQYTEITGNITTDEIQFMQFEGGETSARLIFEAWSRRPGQLTLEDMKVNAYSGEAAGRLEFAFPRNSKAMLKATADIERIELNTFLDTLQKKDQKLDGFLSGNLTFAAHLLDYPTYEGEGEFQVDESSLVDTIVLANAPSAVRSLSLVSGRLARVKGEARMAGQEIHFPELLIEHPGIRLAAEGYLDFEGRLFFDVVSSIIGQRLENVPLIGALGTVLDRISDQIVVYRVRGKLGEPSYSAIPGVVPSLEKLAEQLDTSGDEE